MSNVKVEKDKIIVDVSGWEQEDIEILLYEINRGFIERERYHLFKPKLQNE